MKAQFKTNRDFYETFMEEEMKIKIERKRERERERGAGRGGGKRERKLEKILMLPLGYCDNDIV